MPRVTTCSFLNWNKIRAEGRVLDSCSLTDAIQPFTVEQGCSTIYVTKMVHEYIYLNAIQFCIETDDFLASQTYKEFGGNPDNPNDTGRIELDDWDL